MRPLSRPDLAPHTSPEWLGWYAQFKQRQALEAQQRQEREAREAETYIEKKRRQGGYGAL